MLDIKTLYIAKNTIVIGDEDDFHLIKVEDGSVEITVISDIFDFESRWFAVTGDDVEMHRKDTHRSISKDELEDLMIVEDLEGLDLIVKAVTFAQSEPRGDVTLYLDEVDIDWLGLIEVVRDHTTSIRKVIKKVGTPI